MGDSIPKQYLRIAGKSILEHSLAAMCECRHLQGVLVTIAENDDQWRKIQFRHDRLIGTVIGGETRAKSVLNGLHRLKENASSGDFVIVHDAVRPCITTEDIGRLLSAVGSDEAGGLLALPVEDTIKQCSPGETRSEKTINRDQLWRAQTPQLFALEVLISALSNSIESGELITDEARAMENMGYQPMLVQGSKRNIKITVPEDLQTAECYLRHMGSA